MHDIYQAQIIAISSGPEAIKTSKGSSFEGVNRLDCFPHVHSSTDVPSHNYWRIDSTVIINETTNQKEALLVSNKRNDSSFYPFTAVGNNLEKIRNHIETYNLNRYRVSPVFSGLSWAARESHSPSRILQIDVQYFCTEWERVV
jgi:hypothetical protein